MQKHFHNIVLCTAKAFKFICDSFIVEKIISTLYTVLKKCIFASKKINNKSLTDDVNVNERVNKSAKRQTLEIYLLFTFFKYLRKEF